MKIFNKYVAIAICTCDVTMRMYCYRISLGYKVILVLQSALSLKTHFRARFNKSCDLARDPQGRRVIYSRYSVI